MFRDTIKEPYAAYLLLYWVVVKGVPRFKHLGIYSEEHPTSMGGFYTELFRAHGKSFQDAHDKIVEIITTTNYYNWTKPHLPFLAKTPEEQRKCKEVDNLIKRI